MDGEWLTVRGTPVPGARQNVGAHPPRAQQRHADLGSGELAPKDLRQSDQGVLACHIRCLALAGDQTRHRGRDDDLDAVAGEQLWSLEDQQRTIATALSLGGRHHDVGQTGDEGFIVLADPEGNELCAIEPGTTTRPAPATSARSPAKARGPSACSGAAR
jgi:hypothetical protein